jgi:integrase
LWYPLLAAAGLRHLTPHAARHTFASRLIANGENLKYVQKQLEHHSIMVTVDTYGHLLSEGHKAAVDRLDQFPAESDLRSERRIEQES